MEFGTYQDIHVFYRGSHSDIHPCNDQKLDRGLQLDGWSGVCTLAILLPPTWLRIHLTWLHTIHTHIYKSQSHCWEVIVLSSYFTQVVDELAIETVYENKTRKWRKDIFIPFTYSYFFFICALLDKKYFSYFKMQKIIL